MTRRSNWRLTTVLLAAAMAASDLTAQTPSPSSRNRRVWTGTIDDREILLGEHDTTPIRRPVQYFQNVQVSFTFVSEDVPDRPGFTRWVSRQLSWTAYGYSASSIESYECISSGSFDLGPADGDDHTTPDQDDRLRVPCKNTTSAPNVWAFIKRPNPKVRLPDIDLGMSTCEPARRWSSGGVRYTLAVSAGDRDLGAVVEVDPTAYPAFVPRPDETLTLTATSSSGPVRFRFVLDPTGTSRFPGYATNANVDDQFLVSHELTDLPGGYANDSPDLIFHPRNFNREEWSTIGIDTVETKDPQTSASVTLTALDYGAVGRLRAYAQAGDCAAGWQPIVFRVGGQSKDSLAIPLDDDDNLIADAREEYRGLDSSADADAEPKGNGMAGDGFTAFEEYRGFVIRGAACRDDGQDGGETSEAVEHIRSPPHHKNLFVHTPDPELVPLIDNFAWSSGLSVHAICERQYVNNDTRVVNFTLQNARLREWRGHTISQAEPQHGVYVKPVQELEIEAAAVARAVDPTKMGPPRFTTRIEVLRAPNVAPVEGLDPLVARYAAGGGGPSLEALDYALRHELGHAVGIPHHSDTVENWRIVWGKLNVTTLLSPLQTDGGPPDFSIAGSDEALRAAAPDALLVEPGPECTESDSNAVYRDEKFAGCLTQTIARRGQQNSGDHLCPMRYRGAYGHYYEPPGSTARFLWSNEVVELGWSAYAGGPTVIRRLYVDAWGGRLLRYQNVYELPWLGRFCEAIKGTGINDLRGDLNHNGNAGRDKSCSSYLVVNDMAAQEAS